MTEIDFSSRNVTLKKQAQLAWCYAAVISIVSNWLNNNQGWSPCQIASWAIWHNRFNEANMDQITLDTICNCCQKNKPNACKTAEAVSPISPVLDHLNIVYTSNRGMMDFHTVANEIDNDRPVIMTFKRKSGAGHASLLIGYEYGFQRQGIGKLKIYDPAANNLPNYKHSVDLQTMTFELCFTDIVLGGYPTSKHKLSRYYTNLTLGVGGLTAPPNWAVYHG